jgi:hypothetical protein
MKRLLPLFLLALALPVFAAAKSNTIVLVPGEVIYARFEVSGKKNIKLVSVSKEKDDKAQLTFRTKRDEKTLMVMLQVENRFSDDFDYELVLHSVKLDRESHFDVSPVVGNKVSFEVLPALTEEMILSGFKLEK